MKPISTLTLLHADTKLNAWSEWAKKTGARGDFWAGTHFDNLTLAIPDHHDTADAGEKRDFRRFTDCATGFFRGGSRDLDDD
nr:hypothetical protein [Erwinia piriflorinigrans]